MKRELKTILLCVLALLLSLPVSSCSTKSVDIFDADGSLVVSLKSSDNIQDDEYAAYIRRVVYDAAQVLMQKDGCDYDTAVKRLFSKGYTVHTFLDATAFEAMKSTYADYKADSLSFGCAAVNSSGGIVAMFSSDGIDCANGTYMPHSAFKPLAVYAPALEKGIITYSTVYEDSAVREVNGVPWPSNPTNKYANAPVTVKDAITSSLNTVAVKCLYDLGTENSIEFLQNSFGLDLEYEHQKLHDSGEDEVVGNVALGSVFGGVTAVDMAGCFGIFANSGRYIKPTTVCELMLGDTVVYTKTRQYTEVIGEDTAYIMNKLLQNVASYGGTGKNAQIKGITVGGKTGTGSDGNWFVGYTPEYSCAVWHGTELAANNAAQMFSDIVSQFTHKRKSFFASDSVVQKAYCTKTGLLKNSGCVSSAPGCYANDNIPAYCDGH